MSATVLVIGLGRETRDWLAGGHADPHDVLVVDERPGLSADDPVLAAQSGRVDVRTEVDLDGEATAVLGELDPSDVVQIVRSPGASPYRTALAQLHAAGVPIVTPTGWWLNQVRPSRVIAITGTKGKSTTAAMTAHVLRAIGEDVALCGNIGVSPLTGVSHRDQRIVLELSSYQLADLDAPVAIAGLTTLLTDHVPWHGSVERYQTDKTRLLDLAGRRLASREAASHPLVADRVDAVADVAAQRDRLRAALRTAGLVGEHLVDDAALAVALADAALAADGHQVDAGRLVESLVDFAPLPHRLTLLGEVDHVRYVDDSISTVPEAALAALAAYRPTGPVTLLLGGDDRGQATQALVTAVAAPDVLAICHGVFGDRLAAELRDAQVDHVHARDLPQAVAAAADRTPDGGTVLLSPAAPSFTTHRDFAHRGEHFAELVARLRSAAARRAGRPTAASAPDPSPVPDPSDPTSAASDPR